MARDLARAEGLGSPPGIRSGPEHQDCARADGGEDGEAVLQAAAEAAFARVKSAVAGLSPWEHLTWVERAEREAGPDTEIVAALDLALWDWKGKRLNRPVHELLGVPRGRMPVTTFSIDIDTAEVMKQKVREASAFPKLKIKLGLPNDEENISAIRSVTDKPITVDANEGWTSVDETKKKIAWLNSVKVKMGVGLTTKTI